MNTELNYNKIKFKSNSSSITLYDIRVRKFVNSQLLRRAEIQNYVKYHFSITQIESGHSTDIVEYCYFDQDHGQ